MANCGNCGGNCSGCSGCGDCLELTSGEMELLRTLGQIPFLPVARKADSEVPVYLEQQDRPPEEYSLILQCLEKRGLIDIDYSQPLGGFDHSAYKDFPVRGSFALTQRGQQVVELLEIMGAE